MFSELPLLLAVPRAAQLLGISRAAAYRPVASGELRVRRLGGHDSSEGGRIKMEDNVFNDLPLLLAVPRAAQLLGISRAAAYRLAASGALPVRRLGGRVYVVTAGLRELAS